MLSALIVLVVLERSRPLRKQVEPSLRREARNLTMAAIAGLIVVLVQTPLVLPLTTMVSFGRVGLLKRASMPAAVETLLAVLLMDYTLYLWHVATHKIDFLWRFHEAHHLDLDLSAVRVHQGTDYFHWPCRFFPQATSAPTAYSNIWLSKRSHWGHCAIKPDCREPVVMLLGGGGGVMPTG
ncbi:MAG: hypothetical protein NVS3B20_04330 [Polyangiales bacterium]